MTQMTYRVPQALQMEAPGYLFRLFGLMLTGMALFKLRILQWKAFAEPLFRTDWDGRVCRHSNHPVRVRLDFAHDWDAGFSVFYGRLYNTEPAC